MDLQLERVLHETLTVVDVDVVKIVDVVNTRSGFAGDNRLRCLNPWLHRCHIHHRRSFLYHRPTLHYHLDYLPE